LILKELVISSNLECPPSYENLASLVRFGVLTAVKRRRWASNFKRSQACVFIFGFRHFQTQGHGATCHKSCILLFSLLIMCGLALWWWTVYIIF